MLTSTILDDPAIAHGFFTRRGGVSEGLYASLNCGVGSEDDAGAVTENRRRAAEALGLGPDRLFTLYQHHSADVVTLTDMPSPSERPKADAMVTALPDLALGILTADCVPALLADPQAGVIGAAHAGWKGAISGVVEATVEAMTGLGARRERILAATGPAIEQPSYEVGPEFRDRFLGARDAWHRFFEPAERPDKFLFDLPGFVAGRLAATGVATIDRLARDTRAEEDLFFSYRRSCLSGERDYGRQISAIALTPR